jgi:hypothetical protein
MAAPGEESFQDGGAIDREIRLNEAWHEADEMAREQVEKQGVTGEAADSAIETWRNLYVYDTAPDTSQHEILRAEGIDLPPADELDDAALTAKLWEVIHALAARQTFLHNTDHLSDRELYSYLLNECFHEITKDIPAGTGWIHGIDILGSYGEEETELHHRFYADDETRARWLEQFPNDNMPPKEKPPYDRDRHLPKSPFG